MLDRSYSADSDRTERAKRYGSRSGRGRSPTGPPNIGRVDRGHVGSLGDGRLARSGVLQVSLKSALLTDIGHVGRHRHESARRETKPPVERVLYGPVVRSASRLRGVVRKCARVLAKTAVVIHIYIFFVTKSPLYLNSKNNVNRVGSIRPCRRNADKALRAAVRSRTFADAVPS